MCKSLLPLKLLDDAETWQIWKQNETYTRIIYIFCPPPVQKNVPAPLVEL